MMPSWAFGLCQSRERYQTQQASLDVAAGFRSRKAPVDVIVQDRQYWTIDAWDLERGAIELARHELAPERHRVAKDPSGSSEG